MIDWIMRRLLSVNRDAAKEFFKAPDDGRKWTISALSYAAMLRNVDGAAERVEFIDKAFWEGHCREAYNATVARLPLETSTWRARKGALRVIFMMLCNPIRVMRGK